MLYYLYPTVSLIAKARVKALTLLPRQFLFRVLWSRSTSQNLPTQKVASEVYLPPPKLFYLYYLKPQPRNLFPAPMPLRHPLRDIQLRPRCPPRPRLPPNQLPHPRETLLVKSPYPAPLPFHLFRCYVPDLPSENTNTRSGAQETDDALADGEDGGRGGEGVRILGRRTTSWMWELTFSGKSGYNALGVHEQRKRRRLPRARSCSKEHLPWTGQTRGEWK